MATRVKNTSVAVIAVILALTVNMVSLDMKLSSLSLFIKAFWFSFEGRGEETDERKCQWPNSKQKTW